ncbi:hypothetical protein F5887DRAFT_1076860 [Amanita rubescens]|nr:hypothetical protein F5887DRAFT_1076860 [Amanita rubescens]
MVTVGTNQDHSSRQIVIAHGSKPVSRPPPAGLPPIEDVSNANGRPKSLYSPTSNKIIIANGTKPVARPLPASLPPKDGSNVNDRSESQPALTTLTGLELIEGRVYKLNRRLSMGITQDGLESGRVFYIGPVLDPSLKLKDNDFFVFVSPFSKELGVDNKIYEEYFKLPAGMFQ